MDGSTFRSRQFPKLPRTRRLRAPLLCSGCARGAISHPPTCSPRSELCQAASAHHLQSGAGAWAGPSPESTNGTLHT
ncbi:uncharacterized protein CC84DRAFT_1159305 [Paraphaeosphaeria sporulosa]|uniref:Uncharacterized protein n=1 Tax=Paraphaeosphaeria sporulosa TaxID=1460663 RepID=A0A177CWK3_9PLEO|nr:uncharacterized protein CC84DRAFT_1159305 [Paraphaeosphaeria sporulosa]OAG11893.1 hypothetical protein CC84DRAFT_1159305 [Paraphaeosphaeria sporulosa]